MTLYASTIFLSAFLLFQVQPLIAKMILPWFGGSAAVWSAAMLFFQLLLLAGYAYAHFVIRAVEARGAVGRPCRLAAGELRAAADSAVASWKPTEAGDPTLAHSAAAGRDHRAAVFPAFVHQSAAAGLVRAAEPAAAMPYRLFALSNFGSMLALVSFPFLVEPQLTSRQQAFSWSATYVLFALLCACGGVDQSRGMAKTSALAPEVDSAAAGSVPVFSSWFYG